ncbi:MAG: alpha/beta hydrolase [Pseudomonadota bacterium]
MDWDAAYDNRAAVPNHPDIIAHWERAARFFRHDGNFVGRYDLKYGDHPRQRYDYIRTFPPARGGVIFVHGGYWRALDKSVFTHLAATYVTQGYDVALVNYPFVDDTRVPQITESVTQAIEAIAQEISDPIHLIGHSVGAHLVARQLCDDIAPTLGATKKFASATLLSGLFDLTPLRNLTLNEEFKLTEDSAKSESPIHYTPMDIPIHIWVGGDELPAFHSQSQALANAWNKSVLYDPPGLNHFTILDPLRDPKSEMNQAILK